MTSIYPWETILANMTPTKWHWDDTGAGHMALVGESKKGVAFMITNEEFSDEINPTEPVLLGIYPTVDCDPDEAIGYKGFPNMVALLAEFKSLAK